MMVLNSSNDNTEPAGTRSVMSNMGTAANRRRRSRGTIAGFASGISGDVSNSGNAASGAGESNGELGPAEHSGSGSGTANPAAATQSQHNSDSSNTPPKPCHSARLALMCCQNAIRMGARTQLGLCPPGRARRSLKAALKQKNKTSRSARSRTQTTQPSTDLGGYFGVDKMLGSEILDNYPAQEEDFLVTTNTFDVESDEEASSGDDDDLNDLDELLKGDSPALDDEEKYKNLNEPIFTPIGAENALVNSAGGALAGPAGTGKLPFNRRKLRYFDAISAPDQMAARAYLTAETRRSKQREVAMLAKRLKQAQRAEKRRLKEEKGIPLDSQDLSDAEDNSKQRALVPANVSKFDNAMLPSTGAALLIESLSLNPLESIEGMSKCYDGIVAAGVALLENNVTDPTSPASGNERRTRTRSEIMAALTPVLITSLEQPSGDVILALAKIRRMCGTARYQRRFVQRVGPSLVRPPNAAMWCLKHQNDMEPLLAAVELIFDFASDIFSKGWRDRGDLLLADSKRAETLNAAAMQLQSLRTGPGESLMLGNSLTGHGGWRTTRVHKDGTKGSNESLAEWEVIAVDRQIRVSISNIIAMDWSPVVVQSKDAELARSYHRSRASARRPSPLPGSSSGDTSPRVTQTTPLSPARAPVSRTPSSPRAPAPVPTTERPEAPDVPIPPSSRPEPNETRARSPIPSPPTTLPAPRSPPRSPPAPNRSSVEDIESRIPREPAGISAASFSNNVPPRSPTSAPASPSRTDVSAIPLIPSALPLPSSPISPSRRALANQARQAIATTRTSTQTESQTAPLSPSSVGTGVSAADNMPARFMSSASSISSGMTGTMGTQPAHYRMLTSTAAERKRTVAACRALRAQITRFEDAFFALHGRPPKGAAERAPLATTYAQYREWKRAIRADAACRIQALCRGARVRWNLLKKKDPRFARIVTARAGRQDSEIGSRRPQADSRENVLNQLSIPAEIGNSSQGSAEIVQAPGMGTIGPDGFPTQGPSGQSLPPQWGNQIVRRRSGGPNDGFSTPATAPRPAASPSSGASVSSTGSSELSRLSLAELQARKRELKQQLKQYDMNFARRHGRMPVKAEKEPIRHLYENYNALKSQISSMESDGGRPSPSAVTSQQSSNVLPQRTLSPVSGVETSGDESASGSRSSRQSQRTPPSSTSGTSNSAPVQDLATLRAEKGRLHQMLRSYERDFFREHQRQVSSFADIRPVAGQYRRYKEIKKAIVAIQQNGER